MDFLRIGEMPSGFVCVQQETARGTPSNFNRVRYHVARVHLGISIHFFSICKGTSLESQWDFIISCKGCHQDFNWFLRIARLNPQDFNASPYNMQWGYLLEFQLISLDVCKGVPLGCQTISLEFPRGTPRDSTFFIVCCKRQPVGFQLISLEVARGTPLEFQAISPYIARGTLRISKHSL